VNGADVDGDAGWTQPLQVTISLARHLPQRTRLAAVSIRREPWELVEERTVRHRDQIDRALREERVERTPTEARSG
jgi:hypothetical protein